mgnify:CR=1 FL=1
MKTREFSISTDHEGMYNITARLREVIRESGVQSGLAVVYCPHTTAGITINENADPDVRSDMASVFDRLIREREPYYAHTLEGDDDMPAHAKSTLAGVSLTIPITAGRLNLGLWQGVYLCEFRNHGGARRIVATVVG